LIRREGAQAAVTIFELQVKQLGNLVFSHLSRKDDFATLSAKRKLN
jgi:hypothetical protein